MYNRYIPQADGSYQRNRMPDKRPNRPPQSAAPNPGPVPLPTPQLPEQGKRPNNQGVQSFLRQLLPKDFDTGDLIVVLLLLLMAGDSEEDRSNAILTLALYFSM